MKRVCALILSILLIMSCFGCNEQARDVNLENSITLDTLWAALQKECEGLPNPTINRSEGKFSGSMKNVKITGNIDQQDHITYIKFENSGFTPKKWFSHSSYEAWVNDVCYKDTGKMTLGELDEFLCIDNPISELKAFYSTIGKADKAFELAVKCLLGKTVEKITNWNVTSTKTGNGIVVVLQFTG